MQSSNDQIEGLTKAINKALTTLRAIGASIDVESDEDERLLLKVGECHDMLKREARMALFDEANPQSQPEPENTKPD